jgi:two-component system sensor histidine kinase/response regulator
VTVAQPISILLVDDQTRKAASLEAVLTAVDCHIVTATSGRDALERVLAQDFAVILLDVHMPDMDAFETATLIRARDRSHSTPIIFLTADDRAGPTVQEAYRLGAVDYLYKPIDSDILRSKVGWFVDLFRTTVALEQRTAELTAMAAELARSEEHFRALIENAFDMILIIEDNGRIRYASPSAERMLGYSGQQITGQRMASFLHPDDLATLRSDIGLLLQTDGPSSPKRRRWRCADGAYRVLESTASNLTGIPSVAGVVVHARDVTDRKRAEDHVLALNTMLKGRVIERTQELEDAIADLEREASERKRAEHTLRETRVRLRTVVNNAPIVLFAVDRLGIFTLFEGQSLRVLGLEPGQLVGQSALGPTVDVTSSSSGAAQLIRAEDVARALVGEPFTVLIEAFDKVFELKYSPNLDADGAPVGAIGIAVDVSERRALEERKDAFVATVSHELRTPLNGIIAISQLLLGTSLDASQQEYAEIIHRSGQALHRLIDDVLTLAKYQSGKVEIDDVDLDPRLTLEDVVALFVGPARAKGLGIVAHIDRDVPRALRGDAGRLRQVLLNLTGNALKFTDTGSVLLRARVDASDAERVTVRFEVHDTGVGIAPGVQARLFQPFEQADASTTTRYGGTGLGLAICRQLVESMGGQIGLDSIPGSGTTFWFVLSLSRDKGLDLVGRADLSGQRVLLICDAPLRAAALYELVYAWSMLGTTVVSAEETTAVLQGARVAGNPFDVVVIALEDASGAGAPLAETLRHPVDGDGQHVILVAPAADLTAISSHAPGLPIVCRPVRSSLLFDALAQVLLGGDTSHADAPARSERDLHGVPAGTGEQILVVDDAPMNQQVARRALEHLGYRPVIADSGQAALGLLAEADFAMVLMDCRMPAMDGLETTRRIRRREAERGLKPVPIVALTANAQQGDRDSCLAAGMDDYMSKPLDIDDLGQVLRRWTSGLQSPSDITQLAHPPEVPPVDVPPRSAYVLDATALAGIREIQAPGEPDFLAEIVAAFLTDAPAYIVELTNALARDDAEALANAAHSLKSGAGYLGARELQQLCITLESLGRSGRTTGAPVLAAELEVTFERTRRALTEELSRQVDAAA